MSKAKFERGDRVKITMPLSRDEGKKGTILSVTGEGFMVIAGFPYHFLQSYMISIEDFEDDIRIVYPEEFLEYAEPRVKKIEAGTWREFDDIMQSLGEYGVANTIKQGTYRD